MFNRIQCRWVDESELSPFSELTDQVEYSKKKRNIYLERARDISFVALGCIALFVGVLALTVNITSVTLPMGLNCLSALPLYASAILMGKGLSILAIVLYYRSINKSEKAFKEYKKSYYAKARTNFTEWGKQAVFESITPEKKPQLNIYSRNPPGYYKISPTEINKVWSVQDPIFIPMDKMAAQNEFKQMGGEKIHSTFIKKVGSSSNKKYYLNNHTLT